MGLKSILMKLSMLAGTIITILLVWRAGWKVTLAFCIGIFIGACVVLYWEYSKNSWLSAILSDVMKDKEGEDEE